MASTRQASLSVTKLLTLEKQSSTFDLAYRFIVDQVPLDCSSTHIMMELVRMGDTVDRARLTVVMMAFLTARPLLPQATVTLTKTGLEYYAFKTLFKHSVLSTIELRCIYSVNVDAADVALCMHHQMDMPRACSELHYRVVSLVVFQVSLLQHHLMKALRIICPDVRCSRPSCRVLSICRDVLMAMPPVYSTSMIENKPAYLSPQGLHGWSISESANLGYLCFQKQDKYYYTVTASSMAHVPLEAGLVVFLLIMEYDGDWCAELEDRTAIISTCISVLGKQIIPALQLPHHVIVLSLDTWVKFVSRCFAHYCIAGHIEAYTDILTGTKRPYEDAFLK